MRTITEINQMISEVKKDIESKKNLSESIEKWKFYKDILLYLEVNPSEDYLKRQEEKLLEIISKVDEKIAYMNQTYRSSTALSNGVKKVKLEFNYDRHKRQLENILFILNK